MQPKVIQITNPYLDNGTTTESIQGISFKSSDELHVTCVRDEANNCVRIEGRSEGSATITATMQDGKTCGIHVKVLRYVL